MNISKFIFFCKIQYFLNKMNKPPKTIKILNEEADHLFFPV